MKICLDAGHNNSGWDTGAGYGGYREQDITFDIVKKIVPLISKYCEVIQTRPTQTKNLGNDLNTSLDERSNIANSGKADYFISIHCNANTNLSASGTESYVIGLGGQAEKLALKITENLSKTVGMINRGVKAQNLAVLRKTNMPAVLVEVGFLSNDFDRSKLISMQNEIAKGIADAIISFLGFNSELTAVNDIVWELNKRGIMTDKELWLKKLALDKDSYWLAYKVANNTVNISAQGS